MKLNIRNDFTLEIPQADGSEKTINGQVRTLTKAEQIEFEKAFKKDSDLAIKLQSKNTDFQKLANRISRAEKQEDYAKADELMVQFEKLQDDLTKGSEQLKKLNTAETTAKQKFEMLVTSDNIKELRAICDEHGYVIVMNTIFDDINAKVETKKP